MDFVTHMLDFFGTAVFAITGALAAGRKRMDIFGVVVLGCVTALGGGTLRDVILGNHPVFWVSDTRYLGVAAIAALGTFVLARRLRLPALVLMYVDAIGLAVFTVIGFQKGFSVTHVYSIAHFFQVALDYAVNLVADLIGSSCAACRYHCPFQSFL